MKTYDNSNINSFLKTLLAVVAAIHMPDEENASSIYHKVKEWAKDAEPFVRAYSIQRSYTKLINKFVVDESKVTIEDLRKVSGDLKAKTKTLEKDTVVTEDQRKMINQLKLVLKVDEKYHTDDPSIVSPSYKQLLKNVHTLGEPVLTAFFVPDGDFEEHLDAIKKIKALALKQLGVATTTITNKQGAEWRERDIVSYQKFQKLKKPVTEAFKTALVQLFRKSGKQLMDFKQVCQMLDAKGVVYDLPLDYDGQINEQGKLFTKGGKELANKPSGRVKMNPTYTDELDNEYVCRGIDPDQYYYTTTYKKSSSKQKFQNVANIADRADTIKTQWRKMFDSADPIHKALSVIYELTYITSARIGSAVGSSKNRETGLHETTYGLRTLLSKHVEPDGNGVKIQYKAKGGKLQTFVIHPAGDKYATRVCSYLLKHRSEKNPEKPIFDIGGKILSYTAVNDLAKTLGMPDGDGIHKFRHLEANSLAKAMFDNCPLKKGVTQKEADAWLDINAEKQVGDVLGHTTKKGKMALKNYIDPQLAADWYKKLNLRKPKWLLDLIEEEKNPKKDEEE